MLGSDPKAPPGGKRPRHEDAADVALEAACAIPSDPETASVVLMQSYEAQAPAEALLRASPNARATLRAYSFGWPCMREPSSSAERRGERVGWVERSETHRV
jgi:hypothetical protein